MKNIFIAVLFFLVSYNTVGQCWRTIASGSYHNIAIKNDGTLWAWGSNASGQLGIGSTIGINSYETVPKQIGTATNWQSINSSNENSFAIKTDGTLWAWGGNVSGELGLGDNTNKNIPIQVGTSTNWQNVAAGGSHTIALKTDGTIWTWGTNFNGQLGNGNNLASNIPIQIGSATDWKTIAVGSTHSLAIKLDGTLWVWGNNINGQLGLGNNVSSNIPIKLGIATDWKNIAAGNGYTVAVKTDATLWIWGRNDQAQLGNGTFVDTNTPFQLLTNVAFQSINDIGIGHTIIIKTDGKLWAWGNNNSWQLGLGNNATITTPIQSGTINTWSTISSGYGCSFAIKADGSLWAWGGNGYGSIGDGTTSARLTPVSISCPTSILPIKLISFTGQIEKDKNNLTWQTASEINSSHFEVEQSIDGLTFKKIGNIKSNGKSTTNLTYNFTHASPFSGNNYYRLKMVDIDGKFEYSNIVFLKLQSSNSLISIYPNPTSNIINIERYNTIAQLQLYDVSGRKINEWKTAQPTIDVSNFVSGNYILKIVLKTGEVLQQRITKQ
ncbi:MAG: T9SS type A sorting domain-containing protein [Ferruginibacter sp.]|nr:T9SS type A sorting domain-containing protein [Ferruginibacter sp.]